ncbi:MAG: TIGR00725 family protein [Planctomycetota bacterium]|nr:MAG: TIGR00725 family protein [Planctomycetota bacterium]
MGKRLIAVLGAGECENGVAEKATEVGRLLADAGCVLITGGLGGVMEAASKGAAKAGGSVIGILPGAAGTDGNAFVGIPIATGMGDARNAVIANTAEAFIALGGAYGTLSEIALALKRGKKVVSLDSWAVDPRILKAETPEQAVRFALE